ncbi:hypothetical protein MAR_007583 [Mya arenaria]|uniref:Uncharacterized protein n=1 Tax=Mya arenaria TaxID=6604 RepID=A0ABY7DBS5_MYAAR|nr:hypothetical protein MAR_007583 [Mya arenaria]
MYSGQVKSQGVCTGMTPCFCQYENGQFLDISSLGRTDGEPRFVNPSIPHNIYNTLGLQNGYTFLKNISDNSITLQYTANKRKSHIKLVCTTGDLNSTYFNAIGPAYQDSPDYFFELRSPLCCPQGTPKVTTRRPTTSKPGSTNPNKESWQQA